MPLTRAGGRGYFLLVLLIERMAVSRLADLLRMCVSKINRCWAKVCNKTLKGVQYIYM